MSDRKYFATIDALRGIAAIGVVLFHAFPYGPLAMTGGYLAVDLFFMLSGFVIALSYDRRLREGMGVREFLTRRAVRLWPMLAVGALLAIVLHGGHAGMIFLLPNPLSPSLLYPANPPFWSLLFEAIAYVAFAHIAPRVATRGLCAIVAISGFALAAFVLAGPAALVDSGADWRAFAPGLARLSFSFALGVLVLRRRSSEGLERRARGLAWILPLALIMIMATVPWRGDLAGPLGLVAIILVFPAMLWLATKWELPAPRFAAKLGDLSYPLYCIHVPILALAIAEGPARPVICAALLALSLLLDRYWDRPARRWLGSLLVRPRAQTRIGMST